MRRRLLALTLLGATQAITVTVASPAALDFVDIAAPSGLTEPTWCGRTEKPHLLESNGTGLALVDYDDDGDVDLYLVNGWQLDGSEIVEQGSNLLYRNRGDGTFEDVTKSAKVGDDSWGSGVGVGDPNGDGLPDLFVTNFGSDILFYNQGDGTFHRAEVSPSIDGWSAAALFFDADGDGDEDLFIAGYVSSTLEEVLHAEPELDWQGMKVMLGPFGLEGEANRYFENLGNGQFRDATRDSGLVDSGRYYTFGALAADLDGDLDLDIYAANDSNPNYLFKNDGGGRFQEVGLWSGAAHDEMGNAQAGMGLAAGDLDDDGRLDLFVSNFHRDVCTFYSNLGDLIFEDLTRPLGIREATYPHLSWGATLSDLDRDGDLDLFVVNGHIYPQADLAEGTSFKQKNLLLRNDSGHFVDATEDAGSGLQIMETSHGLATGDIDGDGDLDLAISNVDAPPTLLRNDSGGEGSWLLVEAPGAVRVHVEAGDRTWIRHAVIGGSFLSVNDPRFHFGLGGVDRIDRMRIFWSDSRQTVLHDLPVNRMIRAAR